MGAHNDAWLGVTPYAPLNLPRLVFSENEEMTTSASLFLTFAYSLGERNALERESQADACFVVVQ